MSEQTKIQKLNEEVGPILDKALEMGILLTVLSVDIKPTPGQQAAAGGISTYLEKDDLIALLQETVDNLKASQ